MEILPHKIYQLIILKHKGVFALIMGNQCTAALSIEHMYGKKIQTALLNMINHLKKGLTWPLAPFVSCLGKVENIDDFLAWKNIIF